MLHDLVCFDAGFTLIEPRQTIADNLAEVLETHGHSAGPEDIRQAWEAADAWFWRRTSSRATPPGRTTPRSRLGGSVATAR